MIFFTMNPNMKYIFSGGEVGGGGGKVIFLQRVKI